MRNQNQPVAVEGYPFIGLFAFVTLVVALLDWSLITVIFLALTLFTVYFFEIQIVRFHRLMILLWLRLMARLCLSAL